MRVLLGISGVTMSEVKGVAKCILECECVTVFTDVKGYCVSRYTAILQNVTEHALHWERSGLQIFMGLDQSMIVLTVLCNGSEELIIK